MTKKKLGVLRIFRHFKTRQLQNIQAYDGYLLVGYYHGNQVSVWFFKETLNSLLIFYVQFVAFNKQMTRRYQLKRDKPRPPSNSHVTFSNEAIFLDEFQCQIAIIELNAFEIHDTIGECE